MTVFLILAALLVAGALLLVIPPMLGMGHQAKDEALRKRQAEIALTVLREQFAELEADRAAGRITQEEYQRTREEIEKRALEEGVGGEGRSDPARAPAWAIGLVIAVPVAAGIGYMALGEPAGLDPQAAAVADGGHSITPEQMAGMVAQLAARLEREPADASSWLMLVRSYGMMGDLATAAETWKRIGDKAPEDPALFADWADLLAAAQGGRFDGEPDRLIQKALELDPSNLKAIALAGTSSFRNEDYAGASAYWERILPLVPPESSGYQSVLASINEAREKAGMPAFEVGAAPAAAAGAATASDDSAEALKISGMVSLAPDLASGVKPDETVFVFVRPAQGGMPVAALRFTVGDLPTAFSFDGAQRMTDGPLPSQLVVAARVSRQGDATARPGDLEGSSAPSEVDASDVQVIIDRVRQ